MRGVGKFWTLLGAILEKFLLGGILAVRLETMIRLVKIYADVAF